MRQIADFLGIELELKFTQSAGMCQFLKIEKSAISLHPNRWLINFQVGVPSKNKHGHRGQGNVTSLDLDTFTE